MRVLILGEGKSGTTALLRSVATALTNPIELFEPVQLERDDVAAEPLVVKKLLMNWNEAELELVRDFDGRVFIARDPRDRLISHLLYDAYNRAHLLSPKRRKRWLDILATKSEKPQSVTFVELLNKWWKYSRQDLLSQHVRAMDRTRRFLAFQGDQFHRFTYEQYVDGDFSQIDNYLGLSLGKATVTGEEKRVARSGTYGDWRMWFAPSDLRVLRPMMHVGLKIQGYDKKDWELTKVASIDPATSVDYVKALFDRRPVAAGRSSTRKGS